MPLESTCVFCSDGLLRLQCCIHTDIIHTIALWVGNILQKHKLYQNKLEEVSVIMRRCGCGWGKELDGDRDSWCPLAQEILAMELRRLSPMSTWWFLLRTMDLQHPWDADLLIWIVIPVAHKEINGICCLLHIYKQKGRLQHDIFFMFTPIVELSNPFLITGTQNVAPNAAAICTFQCQSLLSHGGYKVL